MTFKFKENDRVRYALSVSSEDFDPSMVAEVGDTGRVIALMDDPDGNTGFPNYIVDFGDDNDVFFEEELEVAPDE